VLVIRARICEPRCAEPALCSARSSTTVHMKLFYQTHSPYARKVLVMAHEVGLAERLEVIHQETSPVVRNDDVFAKNPLGKVPVLVTEQGDCLFDSTVIVEYLDGLHDGPRMIPPGGAERWHALRLQALVQGIADAGIALRWEITRRPEALRWPALADGYRDKLVTSYDFIERDAALDGPVDIGQIALATGLSWIAFRELPSFGERHPRIARWYEEFSRRPSMLATPLSGETRDER
jgi:glutathione S-transferase